MRSLAKRAKPGLNRLGEGGEASFQGLSFDESVGSVRLIKMSADLDRLFPTSSGDGGTPTGDGLGIDYALPCLAGGEAWQGIVDAKRAGLDRRRNPCRSAKLTRGGGKASPQVYTEDVVIATDRARSREP
jgi:hypothetical protein